MKSKILLIVFLFLISAESVIADQEFFPFTAALTADNVNVRAGGSTNYERMGQLTKVDEVVVVDEKYQWYKIRLPKSAPSYIHEEYITNDGYIVGSNVNVRARPSVKSTVVTKVLKGERLRIIEHKEGWYKVVPTQNSFGWVAKDFLIFKTKDITEVGEFIPEALEDVTATPKIVKEDKVAGLAVFEGKLKSLSDSSDPHIHYQIVNSFKSYRIYGYEHMLDAYENYTVKVEGLITDEDSSSPLINAKSIQLVL